MVKSRLTFFTLPEVIFVIIDIKNKYTDFAT